MKIRWLVFMLASIGCAATPDTCVDLANFKIPGVPMVITKAVIIFASAAATVSTAETSATSATIPSHCQADGMIDERTGADGKTYDVRGYTRRIVTKGLARRMRKETNPGKGRLVGRQKS